MWVSAQEVIAFHDRILQRFPGVAGLADPGRAQALIYRVQNRVHYEGVTDLFELAATYLTVEAATGEKTVGQLARCLRERVDSSGN
ncbi:hypothetical protein OM237_04450 [Escherichia albertii]|nr:hypothetical protein [Escherichia albertii]